jgi:hypothetical protein
VGATGIPEEEEEEEEYLKKEQSDNLQLYK